MHILADFTRKQSPPDELPTIHPVRQIPDISITPNSLTFEEAAALPLEFILGPKDDNSLSDRVLARLIQSEAHEVDAHLRDDYRISWHIVHICQSGEAVMCSPQVLAWYKVLGCHPDHVWPRILARRQALLGESISARKQRGKPSQAGADSATPPSKKSAPVPNIQKKGATA